MNILVGQLTLKQLFICGASLKAVVATSYCSRADDERAGLHGQGRGSARQEHGGAVHAEAARGEPLDAREQVAAPDAARATHAQ